MATGGERVFQRAVRAVARATLGKGQGEPVEAKALRRILVVRTDDRVGNVLLTTPLLRALREGLPHVRIDWLLAARRRHLVDGLFLADQLIPYDKRKAARNPFGLGADIMGLRGHDYDAVIDAAHYDAFSLTAALLTRWTGAPVRIGHERGDAAHYYSHAVPVPEDVRYDVGVKLELLKPLGLQPRGIALETSAGIGPQAADQARATVSGLKLDPAAFAVVNPGARKENRRFAPERYAQLVRRIGEETGLKSVVVWGPGEEHLAEALVSNAGGAAVLAPPTDLHQLAALLRQAQLLVTNDTGPMHLGVACGAPTLAVFTQADSERWGHPIESFRAISAGEDAPGDPLDEAVNAAAELVRQGRPAPF